MWGASWFYAPGRWDTADGCVPVRVVWAYFSALGIPRARTALDTMRGIGLAFAGEEHATRLLQQATDESFPEG